MTQELDGVQRVWQDLAAKMIHFFTLKMSEEHRTRGLFLIKSNVESIYNKGLMIWHKMFRVVTEEMIIQALHKIVGQEVSDPKDMIDELLVSLRNDLERDLPSDISLLQQART